MLKLVVVLVVTAVLTTRISEGKQCVDFANRDFDDCRSDGPDNRVWFYNGKCRKLYVCDLSNPVVIKYMFTSMRECERVCMK